MSFSVQPLPPQLIAITAATLANCTAADTREPSAAFVSFRWQQPSVPPTQNDDSAAHSLISAC